MGAAQVQRFKGTLVSLSLPAGLFFFFFDRNSPKDAFWKIGLHEGFTALWRGLPVALVLTVPATALYPPLFFFRLAIACNKRAEQHGVVGFV